MDELERMLALLENPEFWENLNHQMEENLAKAAKCLNCHLRCDPPFGDGVRCLECASRPTAACMRTIVH